jgi:hypothetical protein
MKGCNRLKSVLIAGLVLFSTPRQSRGKPSRRRLFAGVFFLSVCGAILLAQASSRPASTSHTQSPHASTSEAGVRPNDGEGSDAKGPSGADLFDAIQARVDKWNADWKETVAKCKNLNSSSEQDPILGIKCLTLFAANGDPTDPRNSAKYDFTIKITSFKKTECVKANGHPGFVCDYEIALSQNNPALTGTLGSIMEGTNITEARFLHADGGWIMAP